MERVVFIILLFIMSNSLSAQIMGITDDFRFRKMIDGFYTKYNLKISDIQGTPYLDEGFIPGKIITNDGIIYKEIPLRYNGFSDDLEFRKGEESYNIDPKTIVKRVEFGGRVFSCVGYDANGTTQNGFFEMLAEGKATLLVKYSVRFLEKEEVKAYADPKPARFDVFQKEYYIMLDGAPAKQIKNKKGLIELFGNQKGEMETFISKNKLSVKDNEALTKIVAHYNSL